MSFLAPLYAAGLLAISLPILFHLIRRTPRKRVTFSSLMFLSASPPQVTRRSRLDNLWLLLLRALAVCLLVLAFTRPFFRDAETTIVSQPLGEEVVILVDSSASMRRDGLWEQAVAKTTAAVDRLEDGDRAAVYTFDARLTPLMTFSQWDRLEPSQRGQHIREQLQEISPGWQASHLDTALTAAADMLQRVDTNRPTAHSERQRIELISDLQQGSRLDGLRAYPWPETVQLSLTTIKPQSLTNAGLQIVATPDEQRHSEAAETIRARIYNAVDSHRDRFELAWADADGAASTGERQEIYVPAGQNRIVKVQPPPQGASLACLKLLGDDHPFDNDAYHVALQPEAVRVWYLGSEEADDPEQARYYLQRAMPDTPARHVDLITPASAEFAEQTDKISLAVLTDEQPPADFERLQQFLTGGGTVLYMLPSSAAAQTVAKLIGSGEIVAEEADVEGYAMLGDVQFDHPLFASFSEARYSDFTKIHVWKHRRIDETTLPDARVLARFDDGAAALVDIPVGAGRLMLLTTGWHPDDSQLALSSKFAPLLNAVLEQSSKTSDTRSQYSVGESVVSSEDAESASTSTFKTLMSSGTLPADEQRIPNAAAQPGLYEISQNETIRKVAVNLHPDESKTELLPVEQWEQLGVPLYRETTAAELAFAEEQQRQLQNRELEDRQKMWHWLILAAVIVLLAETWLAGRMSRVTTTTNSE